MAQAGTARAVVLGEDVGLAQDQVVLAVVLDLGAAVLAEDDLVADRDVERDELAVLPAARADGQDAAALRLLLGGVGQDDAARGGLLLLEDLDDDAVAQRLQVHGDLRSDVELALSSVECQIVADATNPEPQGRSARTLDGSHGGL